MVSKSIPGNDGQRGREQETGGKAIGQRLYLLLPVFTLVLTPLLEWTIADSVGISAGLSSGGWSVGGETDVP